MEKDITIKYKNEDITVVWQPSKCTHSKNCWKQLGDVFKPIEKPWVKMDGASTDRIVEQVKRCPSGALTHQSNSDK